MQKEKVLLHVCEGQGKKRGVLDLSQFERLCCHFVSKDLELNQTLLR